MIKYCFFLLVPFLLFSCSSSNDSAPESEELILAGKAKAATDSSLISIWNESDIFASTIGSYNLDETAIRSLLSELLNNYPTLQEVLYMDNQGILKYIEPADYKSSEGTNVSQQEQNIRLFQTGKPVISNLFKVVEGYYAVVMETPVKNNGSTVGSISSLFKPGVFISNSTNQLIQGKVNDFFVMATDGTMIYDIDTTQIGRNVFTDTLYQSYTDLIKAAHKVADSESGQTDYTFIDNNQHTIINKTVWWKTSDYYGTKWKFCIVKNIN